MGAIALDKGIYGGCHATDRQRHRHGNGCRVRYSLCHNKANPLTIAECPSRDINDKGVHAVYRDDGDAVRNDNVWAKFAISVATQKNHFLSSTGGVCPPYANFKKSTTATAVIATAPCLPVVSPSGRAGRICRDRAGRQTVDDTLGLSVVGKLGCQLCVFCTQRIHLLIGQEANDTVGAVLNGSAGLARLGREIVVHAVNGSLSLATTIADLMRNVIEATLDVVAEVTDALVDRVHALVNGGIHATETLAKGVLDIRESCEGVGVLSIKTVAKTVLNAVQLIVDARSVETSLDFTTDTTAVATIAPTAVAEQSEENENGKPITAKTTETAIAHAVRRAIALIVAYADSVAFCKVTHVFSSYLINICQPCHRTLGKDRHKYVIGDFFRQEFERIVAGQCPSVAMPASLTVGHSVLEFGKQTQGYSA